MDDRDKGVYTPGTKPGCFLINNVNGWGPTLGAGQKKHLSPAEENVPSVLKLIIPSVVPGMPASISSILRICGIPRAPGQLTKRSPKQPKTKHKIVLFNRFILLN